jgi:hypothetical protein
MKVKIVSQALAVVCASLLIQGCSLSDSLQYFTPEETTEKAAEVENITEDELLSVSGLYYAYYQLDGELRRIYLEMLYALDGMKENMSLSTLDTSVLDKAFNCVMNDHPELFYVNGYSYTEYTKGSTVTEIGFSGTYSMTSDEREEAQAKIDASVAECMGGIPSGADEYETVKYFYDWVIDNTEYDKTAENNQNICSVFLNGKSVCQGYAKALQYLLQKSGIQCLMVTGYAGSERHAWDLAKVNGGYYYLDPTWGDASYSYSDVEDIADEFVPSINYDYFLVTTDELTRTHSIETLVELPECVDTEENYFVREGLYFSEYDDERLSEVFNSEASREAGYVTIKCAEGAYDDITTQLIDEQKVFEFIDVQGASISYTLNPKLKTVSFWNIY